MKITQRNIEVYYNIFSVIKTQILYIVYDALENIEVCYNI